MKDSITKMKKLRKWITIDVAFFKKFIYFKNVYVKYKEENI